MKTARWLLLLIALILCIGVIDAAAKNSQSASPFHKAVLAWRFMTVDRPATATSAESIPTWNFSLILLIGGHVHFCMSRACAGPCPFISQGPTPDRRTFVPAPHAVIGP
jgi:hypothetical protein